MMKRNVCFEDNVTRKDGKGNRGDGGESNYFKVTKNTKCTVFFV